MSQISTFLQSWLEAGGGQMGQVLVREIDGQFEVRNVADENVDSSELKAFSCASDAREVSKYAEDGEFRPLRAQSNLAQGWVLRLESPAALQMALDAIYPGALGMWASRDSLRITPLRDTLERQTGMYRYAHKISDEGANSIIAKRCEATCLRQILWPLSSEDPAKTPNEPRSNKIHLLCPDACNLLVADARKQARNEHSSPTGLPPS